jgi:hypothetical protein
MVEAKHVLLVLLVKISDFENFWSLEIFEDFFKNK